MYQKPTNRPQRVFSPHFSHQSYDKLKLFSCHFCARFLIQAFEATRSLPAVSYLQHKEMWKKNGSKFHLESIFKKIFHILPKILLLVQKSGDHHSTLVVEIPISYRNLMHPNGALALGTLNQQQVSLVAPPWPPSPTHLDTELAPLGLVCVSSIHLRLRLHERWEVMDHQVLVTCTNARKFSHKTAVLVPETYMFRGFLWYKTWFLGGQYLYFLMVLGASWQPNLHLFSAPKAPPQKTTTFPTISTIAFPGTSRLDVA